MDHNSLDSEESIDGGRRRTLQLFGGAVVAPLGIGGAAYANDRTYTDEDEDGIPDSKEESPAFNRYLEDVFGADQFGGLDSNRKDLLLDVRYVGDAIVSATTKQRIVRLFRENGIHLQWLDYPVRYDRSRFESQYGNSTKRILWSPGSFYYRTIEPELRNVALQLIVVPGMRNGPHKGKLHSPWSGFASGETDGYVNGFSLQNRAVVAERHGVDTETRLVLHEIAHFALCHDNDPGNVGVMGPNRKRIDLMDHEWATLRNNLDAVRDTTGFDVALRSCLWKEYLGAMVDRLPIPDTSRNLPVGSSACGGCSGTDFER